MENIKVFITEDESLVREGLRDIIPWEKYGFEFVGDAPDGEMALPMIRRLKPDILITDIKMPFMDGLALSSVVSREFPDTKIIIISGYNDFEYARKAIELNVDQYLTKPITKTSIIAALSQTRKKIEDEREQKNSLDRYEQDQKKFESFQRRDFFEKLAEGSLSIEQIYENARELGIDINADGYNFVIFTVQSVDEINYSIEAANVLDDLRNSFLRYPNYILFRCNILSYAVLITGDADNISELTTHCTDTIKARCSNSEQQLNWYISVGTPTYRLSSLAQCYADANHILAYRHIMPDCRIFTAETLSDEGTSEKTEGFDLDDPASIDPMIIRNFIQTGIRDEAEVFVGKYLENFRGAQNSTLFIHYLIISARINTALVLQELGCSNDEFLKQIPPIDRSMSPDDLRRYLISVLSTAIDMRDSESTKQNGDIVESAIKYIDKNYTDENISLNSVANAVNISANYLSALFTQRTGESFVDYITAKRMLKAKQLLRHSSKRTGEIAYEVGYKDPRYFSFVFKKTQGCTPKSFRSGEADSE